MPETGDAHPWPFPVSELTAGLRRYVGAPSLRVKRLWEEPLVRRSATGDLRALGVEVEIEVKPETKAKTKSKSRKPISKTHKDAESRTGTATGIETRTFNFVVKEPVGTTRAGLAGVGLREVGVYRSLAPQLPVLTPQLIAADSTGAWLVMENLPASRAPNAWTADDYKAAIKDLARLHDCFWSLQEDLSIYPWMGRPLTTDFQIHVVAAAAAVEKIVFQSAPAV
ncbi:MAG: hypothetical protein HY023_03745, partial [Chloroflexi bacterium]|nr:hypothetical protein [Chloroflexota bacterium]